MTKDFIIEKAKKYSRHPFVQKAYVAGFQACCNIIRKEFQSCDNDEFLSKMEELSEASFIYFDY